MITLTRAQLVDMNKAVIGTIVYTEGQYGAQCVGWFKWLCSRLGIPVWPTGTNWAAGYWTKNRERYAPYFTFITDPKNFQDGDIIIFPYGGKYTPGSHICMKIGAAILSQNQDNKPYVTLIPCNYFGTALGAFRFKGLVAVSPKKDVYTIAQEVIQGKWGNGAVRKSKLTAAGYDYATVQAIVNQILYGSGANDKVLRVGVKVRIKAGARDLNTNQPYAAFVYNRTYTVSEIIGNRVVFVSGRTVIGAVTKSNVIVQ